MTEHVSIERMNEGLDGLLSDAEITEIERHLEECGPCRNEHARLSEVLRGLGALPREAAAPEGIWAGIESRLGGRQDRVEGDEVAVYRLPTAPRAARRVSFSLPQAMAAGIAIAVVSAGLMWMAIGGGPEAGMATIASGAPGGAAARAVSLEEDHYADVVVRLEEILAQGREVLTQETLVSIEESLATIDMAISEIESALADDPNSDLLRRMLVNHQRTRLGVLQRAAAAVQAQT